MKFPGIALRGHSSRLLEPAPAESQSESPTATEDRSRRPAAPGASVEQRIQPREGPIRRILVPTDFSPASVKAVKHAVALANQCYATLTILHVIDINAQTGAECAADLMKRLWGEGAAQMGQLAWSLSGLVEAQTTLAEGLPWEVIVEKARDFDLVLLGSSRDGRRLFSQHTAQRVVENAPCPVMVVHDRDLVP